MEDGHCRLGVAREPSDFVVRAEAFGVPQRRHRVFIIGLRADVAARAEKASVEVPEARRTLVDVIGDLPALRSGLSRGGDNSDSWEYGGPERRSASCPFASGRTVKRGSTPNSVELRGEFREGIPLKRSSTTLPFGYGSSNDDLRFWLEKRELRAIAQHETRGHMASDLFSLSLRLGFRMC